MGLYERIKEIASEKGYSINRLEKELGFARSSISKFNKNVPSAEKIKMIADLLGVSLDTILNDEESAVSHDIKITTDNGVNVVQLFSGINSILGDMLEEQKLNEFNQKLKETLPDQFGKPEITLAAHLEGEDFTEDEMNDIINYIEFVKSRKNKK